MSKPYTMGLGEPKPEGKRTLFMPPIAKEDKDAIREPTHVLESGTRQRIRTTIELSTNALAIIQQIQNQHRLEAGKVLPLWKLVSQVIEEYGASHLKCKNQRLSTTA